MNLETRSGNRTPPIVGRLLRDWRISRGLSQLDLAEHSGFSARHVSFIETGRTQPSRQALLVLAESLDLPLRDRNRLLEAGGFARVFSETPLAANEMAQIRSVLQFILDRHSPYAAVVLDRHSNCLMGNRAAGLIMARLVEPHFVARRREHPARGVSPGRHAPVDRELAGGRRPSPGSRRTRNGA